MNVGARAAAVGALIGLAAGCTEIGSDPDQPVAIAFDTLPAAAIVYGDTLRDINGVAAPLTAHAYNVDGDEIPNPPIEFFVSDTLAVVIDSTTRFAIATSDTARKSVIVRAQTLGIPAGQGRTLELVLPPDSLARARGVPRDRIDTARFAAADTVVVSPTLVVRVLHHPIPANRDSVIPIRAWRVRYTVVHPAAEAGRGDTLLVDEGGRRSTVDTTSSDGSATRQLRLRRPVGGVFPDSLVVDAMARYRDGDLAGSPVRFIVLVRPQPATTSFGASSGPPPHR